MALSLKKGATHSEEEKGGSMVRLAVTLLITVALVMTAEDFELLNEQLEGKVAVIELADGSTIKKAKKVVVEANFTYWKAKGKEQKVETGKVIRIQARSKSKGLIGLGAGAAAGAFLSYFSGEGKCNQASDPWCTRDAEGGYALIAAGFFALLGFAVTKAIPRKQKIVYEVPVAAGTDPAASRSRDHDTSPPPGVVPPSPPSS
jgi:hypothetical protein